ncbi:MAG: hypothetical protein NT022_13125 [Deltaproteobacteria bacterium]|nr:hypothetical protein [Deltaproteobacteria bacterium]
MEKFWKITIKGPSIQGVMLRERIVTLRDEFPNGSSILGFVRNWQDWVEIIFKSDDALANTFFHKIGEIPGQPESLGMIEIREKKLEVIPSPVSVFGEKAFEDFKVKRESEQKEMMLALQGAGKVFIHSAMIQRDVSHHLKARDEAKVKGILLSLYYEALHNKDMILAKTYGGISLTALSQAFSTPPLPTDSFAYQLSELFLKLELLKNNKSIISEQSEINSISKSIDTFVETLMKELGDRGIKVEHKRDAGKDAQKNI